MAQNSWLPIETAPKDGTEILIWDKHYVSWALWNKHDESWGDHESATYFPTHWQPLPAPPTTSPAPSSVEALELRILELKSANADLQTAIHEADARVARVEREKLAERETSADLQAVFDLQWKRMGKATEQWRAANPGKELISPDLGTLLEWLMSRALAAEAQCERLREYLGAISQCNIESGECDTCTRIIKDALRDLAATQSATLAEIRREYCGCAGCSPANYPETNGWRCTKAREADRIAAGDGGEEK